MITKFIVPILVVGVLFTLIIGILSMWRKVSQDKALVVTGMKRRVIKGGGGFVIPLLERTDVISLENMTINVDTRGALTDTGVPINVDGVTVIKVKSDDESIYSAVEQFNTGKEKETIERIKQTAKDVLDGKLREIVSTMSVEQAYQDRETFTSNVQGVAAKDLESMGLEIKTFTIKDISDDNGYLEALGKKRIAEVRRDAEIAEAEAKRDSKIKTAEAKKEGDRAQLIADTQVAEAQKDKELKIQSYNKDQQKAKAEADLSYEIQTNKTRQEVTETEMAVEILRKQRQTEVAQEESKRRERELDASVKKQADADKYRREKDADAKKYEKIQDAEAESESIRKKGQAKADAIKAEGEAEANSIQLRGLAEAEAMSKKAEAFKEYNDAAVMKMIIEVLPEIAKNIAEPLSKTEKIVIVDNGQSGQGGGGASKIPGYVGSIMSQVPEIMKATTGVDLMSMLTKKMQNAVDVTNNDEEK